MDNVGARFARVDLNERQARATQQAREEFALTAEIINNLVKDGREKSLVLTALEDALHWTIRAIELDPEANPYGL